VERLVVTWITGKGYADAFGVGYAGFDFYFFADVNFSTRFNEIRAFVDGALDALVNGRSFTEKRRHFVNDETKACVGAHKLATESESFGIRFGAIVDAFEDGKARKNERGAIRLLRRGVKNACWRRYFVRVAVRHDVNEASVKVGSWRRLGFAYELEVRYRSLKSGQVGPRKGHGLAGESVKDEVSGAFFTNRVPALAEAVQKRCFPR
jgi:hypothetical protein